MDPTTERDERLIEADTLTLRSVRDGSKHVIELVGELDMHNATALSTELTRVEASDAEEILLDLSRLTFIDSSGLRLFLIAARRSHADHNRLRFRSAGYQVERVLALTGIAGVLPFEGSKRPPV
jgi:anti-sigma B factor antagonist